MSSLEVRQSQSVSLSNDQLKFISGTEFVPPGLRGNLPAILACVATGRELGIGDMEALRSIHVIDGKPTFSAELMVKLVRKRGHSITGEVTDKAATVVGRRADNGDEMTVVWTIEMAEAAGLAGKQNWRKYRSAMLWARAVSQLCRMLFADCFAGGTYTPEELGSFEDSSGEPQGGVSATAPALSQAEPDIEPASPDEPTPPGWFPPLPDEPPPEPASDQQKKKLNVLVGKLRPDHISTEQLWQAHFLDPVNGLGEDGLVHWSPLRERLSKDQASRLIERLTALEERVMEPPATRGFEIPESAQ